MAMRRSRNKSARKTKSARRKKDVHVSAYDRAHPRKVKAARRAVKRAEAHLSSLEKQARRRKR